MDTGTSMRWLLQKPRFLGVGDEGVWWLSNDRCFPGIKIDMGESIAK